MSGKYLQGGHGRSTSSYIVMVANVPIIFKVEPQGLNAQPTVDAEPVAMALTIKEEVVLCSNTMLELGVDESFGSVPLYIDNTLALHVASSRTYSPRAKHIALRYNVFVQELVEGKISIPYGTKYLSKHRHRNVIDLIHEFNA